MPRILSVATAVPPHRFSQDLVRETCREIYKDHKNLDRLFKVFASSGVQTRYAAFPLEYYTSEKSFDERNADFVTKSLELLEKVTGKALERAKISVDQVDHIYCVTTTGLATPSLEALLAHRMGFRPDVRRSPLFGIGCAGGVAALSRAKEYLEAFPGHRVLVLSVELCGQVFSSRALTPTDFIGATLFGDGAAAAVLTGGEPDGAGPEILFTGATLFPGTQEVMGWKFTSDGMRLQLSKKVPRIVIELVKPAVEEFLARCETPQKDVRHWILHPGGPRVMEAYEEAFGITPENLVPVREVLGKYGNLSSAASMFVLDDVMRSAKAGETGLMLALGPGFAAEMLLLRW
jgi:alkylresorcinol/alkylpyrone synthase